jgi:glycosyltransferase involved in cell wall biosynthesis
LRITWFSNAPWTPTGYGTQTAQVIRRMKADGHDVAVASNYGEMARVTEWEGIPVFPGGAERYSTDMIERVHRVHTEGKLGVIIGLYDSWVIGDATGTNAHAWWTPVDHDPLPPKVLQFAEKHPIIAMSRFGEATFAKDGITAPYIPHGIETATFRPTPSDFRKRLEVPEDAYLVVINAANQDNSPSRKAWPEMLFALNRFMRDRDDVYVYLHTDVNRPSGISIPAFMVLTGMDVKRVRAADYIDYRMGIHSAQELAEAYSAADVLLATSRGEGFGLAVPEAMACGTPAIVTDFSAQPEIVGDTGWTVTWQPDYDAFQGSFWATPWIGSIVGALQKSYAERGSEVATVRREAARQKAMEYDADHVYAEHWRPYLAQLEAELEAPVKRRPGNTKAAKRRRKGAR